MPCVKSRAKTGLRKTLSLPEEIHFMIALAGMSLNTYQADPIYISMTRYAKFPEGLFKGSAETLDALRRAIRFPAAGGQ